MRLDVGELAAEQLLRPFDRQRLDRVGRSAALVVAAARVAFGIFVGENRALCFEHRLRNDILRRDQLDLRLLAAELVVDRVLDGRVDLTEPAGEEAVRNPVALFLLEVGGAGHQSLSCSSWESWSTRRWWRPPAKSVSRKAKTQALAMSAPTKRPPSASTLASLCSRASCAESGSSTRAQRHFSSRLTAI